MVNSQDAPLATEKNRNEARMNAKREYCEKSFTTIVYGRRIFSPKMYQRSGGKMKPNFDPELSLIRQLNAKKKRKFKI